jgi:hypothetical protein
MPVSAFSAAPLKNTRPYLEREALDRGLFINESKEKSKVV